MLSDSRRVGMQAGAIPLTEIEAYMRMHRITDPDLIDEWIYLVREMDREYIRACSDKEAQ